jgi:diadenosine tetraphosphate (Ap4A) HIT family hydrolase
LLKHVHLHILPRKKGDFKRNDELYEKLRDHDKEDTAPQRSLDEMAQEAREFRKLFGVLN